MSEKTIKMTIARPSESEVDKLHGFMSKLEEGLENLYGNRDDNSEFENFTLREFKEVSHIWRRVLFSTDVMLKNFTDPSLEHLAFKPELLEAVNYYNDNLPNIKKRNKRG